MASNSVDQDFGQAIEQLFVDPVRHPDPEKIANIAEVEASGLLDEIKAIADVLWLADQNQDTQFNEDDVANTCRVIRRLVEQKQALDSLASRAREAAKPGTAMLRSVVR